MEKSIINMIEKLFSIFLEKLLNKFQTLNRISLKKLFNEIVLSKNRGALAGGKNTTKNGSFFEEQYRVDKFLTETYYEKYGFIKFMKTMYKIPKYFLLPDSAIVNSTKKTMKILEYKYQKCTGSVDEKIQTGLFKKYYYEKTFSDFKVYFAYCLSSWFRKEKYKLILEYLTENGIIIFFPEENLSYKNLIEWCKTI